MTPALLVLVLAAADQTVPVANTLTLKQALDTAKVHQPTIRQAAADYEAARQRSFEARAPLLPQVNASISYTRRTQNFVSGSVVLPSSADGGSVAATSSSGANFNTYNSFGGSITLSQLIWDFGQTWDRWKASQASAEAYAQDQQTHIQTAMYGVRTAFFAARAAADLLTVAADTVANEQRHLDQVKGFVDVGTRPEIDLAQARTDLANAKVQLIQAQNGFATTRAQLNQAMGVEGPTNYAVSDDRMEPLEGENGDVEQLVNIAVSDRPELQAVRLRAAAQDNIIGASRGAYGPSLSFATSGTLGGASLDGPGLAPNWNAGVVLSWNLFGGLGTMATVSEAQYNYDSLLAQADATRQAIRLDIEQSQLAVHAAVESLSAADEALTNAKDRLRLAEGRYQTGVGNIIELGDAQLALTTAAGQRVQADFNVSSARATLWHALGRP